MRSAFIRGSSEPFRNAVAMATNFSFVGFQHDLETEIQRVAALIRHAEERLEVQQQTAFRIAD
jgi:hypothetical protein